MLSSYKSLIRKAGLSLKLLCVVLLLVPLGYFDNLSDNEKFTLAVLKYETTGLPENEDKAEWGIDNCLSDQEDTQDNGGIAIDDLFTKSFFSLSHLHCASKTEIAAAYFISDLPFSLLNPPPEA